MTTLLYSGLYDSDHETIPFEVDPNFFYLTSCDLPNITIIKHHKNMICRAFAWVPYDFAGVPYF